MTTLVVIWTIDYDTRQKLSTGRIQGNIRARMNCMNPVLNISEVIWIKKWRVFFFNLVFSLGTRTFRAICPMAISVINFPWNTGTRCQSKLSYSKSYYICVCIKKFFSLCLHVCLCLYTHGENMEVGGQLCGVSSLLPPCEFQGVKAGPQAWQKTALPTEPPHQASSSLILKPNMALRCGNVNIR